MLGFGLLPVTVALVHGGHKTVSMEVLETATRGTEVTSSFAEAYREVARSEELTTAVHPDKAEPEVAPDGQAGLDLGLQAAVKTSARTKVTTKPEPDAGEQVVLGLCKAKTLQKVMGPIGGTLAIVMFLSAGPVMLQIVREGTVGGFSAFPYVVQMCNCALWVIYALSDKGSPLGGTGTMLWPLACNAVGLVIASCAYSLYFLYCTQEERKPVMLWSWPAYLALAGFAIYVFTRAPGDKRQLAAEIAGNACLVINIIMYMGPLAGIKTALTTQSTRYLPLSLGVTTLTCSTPWFLFGVGIYNYKIWVPNAGGILFGIVQISIWVYIRYVVGEKGDDRSSFHVSALDEPSLQARMTYGNLFDAGAYRGTHQ